MTQFLKDAKLNDCSLCANSRVVADAEGFRACSCVKVGRALQCKFETVVAQQYEDVKLSQIRAMSEDQKKLLNIANRFVAHWQSSDASSGLYLYSKNPGSGKTLVACAIANELALASQAIEANVYFNALRSCYDSSEPQSRYVNAIASVPVLVLDDLGVGMTDKSDEWLLDVLNARTMRKLCTIITSNHAPDELPKLEARTLSRLASHCHPIKVPDATDFRILNAKQKRLNL
jgi:DNA replication protein DnaC